MRVAALFLTIAEVPWIHIDLLPGSTFLRWQIFEEDYNTSNLRPFHENSLYLISDRVYPRLVLPKVRCVSDIHNTGHLH